MLPSQEIFLEEDPTFERRWQALSLNNQAWFARWAVASGGEVSHEGGMTWTYTPMESQEGQMTISSPVALQTSDQVSRIFDWYRSRHPLHGVLCWYLTATPPGDLAARLFARGFEPNWQPHWMWCDLRHLQRHHLRPSTFAIQVVEDEPGRQADDLPYYCVEDKATLAALHHTQPRHVWHLAAFQKQQVVGRCLLNVTTGEWGVVGLFNMGVTPSARKQGIGTALTQAACELAQQMGCHHVVLNATPMGEPIYRRVGFQSMGYGHTWYLRAQTLTAPAPSKDQVTFLEAVGRGDIAALGKMSERLEETTFNAPSTGGLTPLDISVRCYQPASAAWLVEHGAFLDLLSAWDLGWKEQIPSLLGQHPELVNVQRGEWHLTPLHVAVERDDIELVKFLLTVPNDLTIKDTQFEATALGWAQHFQRTEIISLIEQHRARQ